MFFFKSTILTYKLSELYVKNLLRMCILQVKSNPTENFKIYSASAGSGKTYQLTKAYLQLILRPGSIQKYRRLLAITFTNKAVGEMKQRILDSLYNFSQENIPEKSMSMFQELRDELAFSELDLKKKAKKTLKELLHNYSFFEVSTIDKFNYKLIRTFAQDLKIAQNFEVVLDTGLLLEEAIGNLLSKTGSDQKLTQVLLDFSLGKVESDKSWNIAYDLFEIGKLVFLENHYGHLKKLQEKKIGDFVALQSRLRGDIEKREQIAIEAAAKALDIIDINGLEASDFFGGYFPKFMMLIAKGNLDINFNAAWKQDFENAQLYKKDANTKDKIEALHPKFTVLFKEIKQAFHQCAFLKNCLNNTIPLSLLNEISKELKAIQNEKDLLPISDFNTLIAKEIKNQPVPFIYERLGEKYRHYFVDEFQDTSMLQWQNLIPLVSNALESENERGEKGSLLLVGDAKQAIYRWRGGRAEQFLNLLNLKLNPFSVPPDINHLETNWRSQEEIVNFNNGFFTHIASRLSNNAYQRLFKEGNRQKPAKASGGYIELAFVDPDIEIDEMDQNCLKTLETVETVLANNYSLGDIAILVRDNKKAVLIADFLAQNNIDVVSPDSLLLSNNEEVLFLISFLSFLENREDKNAVYQMLRFISDESGTHDFIAEKLNCFEDFLLDKYGLNVETLQKMTPYDLLELVILKFDLANDSDTYIMQFLDEVFQVGLQQGFGIGNLLRHWKVNGHRLAVSAPENLDAIKVMTIHKAKGLEFPVVIFPYADSKIIEYRGEKMWVDVKEDSFLGFDEVLLNFNKSLGDQRSEIRKRYQDEIEKLELDAFNVLYVAMTRAMKALFVLAPSPKKSKSGALAANYSGFFKDYLMVLGLWNEAESVYSFGKFVAKERGFQLKTNSTPIPYIYTQKYLYDSKIISTPNLSFNQAQVNAIYLGDLFHRAMAHIKVRADIPRAIAYIKRQNQISLKDERDLESNIVKLIGHTELSPYFSEKSGVHLNEKEIFTEDGSIIRPDKIILNATKAVVIDYKTGQRKNDHIQQITYYSKVLSSMDYNVEQKILVYINEGSVEPLFI